MMMIHPHGVAPFQPKTHSQSPAPRARFVPIFLLLPDTYRQRPAQHTSPFATHPHRSSSSSRNPVELRESTLRRGVILIGLETVYSFYGAGGQGAAAGGEGQRRDARADAREHRRLHRRHRGARPALRLPHRGLARRRPRRCRSRRRHLLLHAPPSGLQRQAARARRNRGGGGRSPRNRAWPPWRRQLHLRRSGRAVLRTDRQVLHGGHHHPLPDRRHRRVPRLHRPEHQLRAPRRLAGHRRARAPAAGAGRALLRPLPLRARALQPPRRRLHRPRRGRRRQGVRPAPGRARAAAVRRPERARGALGRAVRLRRRRLLLRGVLPHAGAGGVHGGQGEVQVGAAPGHRRSHRRVRGLRRLRVPRLRRRHQGHRHAESPQQLVHRGRQGRAVRRAGAHVRGDDAPDPRDRGGAAVRAGRVGKEAMPWRRHRRAGRAPPQPRGGGGGARRDSVLRAGVRGVRGFCREHRVRAALLRAAGDVPPPRRGADGGPVGARRGLLFLALRAGLRRAWHVHGLVTTMTSPRQNQFLTHTKKNIVNFLPDATFHEVQRNGDAALKFLTSCSREKRDFSTLLFQK